MEGRGGLDFPPSINQQKHLFPFRAQKGQNHEPSPTAFAAYQTTAPTQGNNQRPPVGQNSDPHDREPSPASSIPSPWQRMKWTDAMVKLLIMIVYCIGDDHNESSEPQPKKSKTSSSNSVLNLMQKKGKWKSVSRAMMEKGFYVSPQQCEDKFNDLNKRYKRVNELIGKGIACRVVENQALLDSMDHISPKAKEEARKLLNSKHLFFREMCAYHNGGSTCNSTQPIVVEEFDQVKDEDDDFSEEEDEEGEEGDDFDERASPELSLQSASPAASTEWAGQVSSIGSEEEKRKWLKRKEVELEEKRVGYLYRALELDRQRFKWMRYCCNKEREMEKMKIMNERRWLENDRMLLLLRKKEQELVGSGAVVIDHFQQMPMH